MKVHFEDEDFELDLDEIDVMQARIIKRQTGLTLAGLQKGLSEVDPDCMVALYWLMKNQNGVTVDMNKVNFKVVKFGQALGEATDRETEEDPTPAHTAPPTT
jgi:hypothetical protein